MNCGSDVTHVLSLRHHRYACSIEINCVTFKIPPFSNWLVLSTLPPVDVPW